MNQGLSPWHDRFWELLPGIVLVFAHAVILIFSGWGRPIFGDEGHFIQTIRQFIEAPTSETIRTYNEMSTPLPFILYALWGKLWGGGIESLRSFSFLIGFGAMILFQLIAGLLLKDKRVIAFATLFFIFHPYNFGFTLYVYTDLIAIAFLLLSLLAYLRNRPVLLFLALTCAILSRQYALFFPLALVMHTFFSSGSLQDKSSRHVGLAAISSFVPFGILALYWGGLAPDNQMRRLYLSDGWGWRVDSFVLYVSLLGVYLLPAMLLGQRLFSGHRIWIIAVVCALPALLFSVNASSAALAVGRETVGLFHRAMIAMFHDRTLVSYLFFPFTVLGYLLLIGLGIAFMSKRKRDHGSVDRLLFLFILFFLLVMPFGYMHWEKYLMLVFPFALLALLCANEAMNVIRAEERNVPDDPAPIAR